MRALLPVHGTPEQVAVTIAQEQRGRVARRQLLQAGVAGSTISYLVKRGILHTVHAGVYIVGPALDVAWGRETDAVLAIGRGSLLSHAFATALWGFTPPPDPNDPVDVTVPGNRTGRRAGIRAHHSGTLDPRDMTIRLRLPVTSPARALLDFADDHSPRAIERALDEALGARIVSRTKVADLLARSGAGRRGTKLLAKLIATRRPSSRTANKPEERLRQMLLDAGLPVPECNYPLFGYEADYYWPEARVVLELDSYQWHSTRSAWVRDRRKDDVFRAHDLHVIRVIWEDVTQQPLALIACVVQALTERTRRSAA